MNKFSFSVKNEGSINMLKYFPFFINLQLTFHAARNGKFKKSKSTQ